MSELVDTSKMALAIVAWAERKAIKSGLPIWSFVAEFLAIGSTRASNFCGHYLQERGWKSVHISPPPENTIVYASEGLGSIPFRMSVSKGKWFRTRKKKPAEEVGYVPTWWKETGGLK